MFEEKSTHSKSICYRVYRILHPKHPGGGSPFRRNECVRRERPIRNRVRITSSLLLWHCSCWCSFRFEIISFSLLLWTSFQFLFLIFWKYCMALVFQSDAGTPAIDTAEVRAPFDALSAASLPLTPTWLGNQQNTIFLCSLHNVVCNSRAIQTKGLLVCRSCSACKDDFESENMMQFLWLVAINTYLYW